MATNVFGGLSFRIAARVRATREGDTIYVLHPDRDRFYALDGVDADVWVAFVGQQGGRGSAKVTFYPGGESLPVLIAQLKSVRNAWVAWPAMIEEAARSRLMEVPIDRMLLLDPQSCFLPAFAAAYDAPAIKYAEGIRDATRSADYAHISVRWFDGPIFSVILADPRDETGWAR